MEHVTVVQEVIHHAKMNHETAHITWFDLEDAFGSVPHMLIKIIADHYHITTIITRYIMNLYSKLEGKVITASWESDLFKFLKGVFAGDPYSGIIFLVVFNPIIHFIKQHQETHGYTLKTKTNVKNVSTTPFADDFNIISREHMKHQTLVTDVENKLVTMGLVIKPSKCRSLSIVKGKYTNITFQLKDKISGNPVNIFSVLDKPMKFLGSEVTGNNTPSAMFAFLELKLKTKLENIDACTLRGEYKVNIYSRFALPSIRFYFSVHHIHKTHMDKLDNIARKFLKKWLNIQTNGVSDASMFHPYMLGLKTPSHIYKEAHAGTYVAMRLKGDKIVNHALDSRLERESEWSRKFSTVVAMDKIYKESISNNKIRIPTEQSKQAQYLTLKNAKNVMKSAVQSETLKHWNEVVKKLTFQGNFIALLIEEQSDITWKGISNCIPKGVLSFALKASVNGLNTPDNLKRWGKSTIDKCKLCGNYGNLEHTLNYCKVSLDQGRTKWRHDSVLFHMVEEIKKGKPDEITMFADLPGHQINGGSIPADILTTAQRPDIVILNRKTKEISLFELSVSFEKNADSANFRKQNRYHDLSEDLRNRGWVTNNTPFEIGSRGFINKRNKITITDTMKKFGIKIQKSKLMKNLGKISLLCSYTLFQAHCQPEWQSPPLLHP